MLGWYPGAIEPAASSASFIELFAAHASETARANGIATDLSAKHPRRTALPMCQWLACAGVMANMATPQKPAPVTRPSQSGVLLDAKVCSGSESIGVRFQADIRRR
jgi:hypothetical protein